MGRSGRAATLGCVLVCALLWSALAPLFAAAAPLHEGAATRYVVVFKQSPLPSDADKIVGAAGGTVVDRLPQLGGLRAVSSDPTFAGTLAARSDVYAVSEDAAFALPDVGFAADADASSFSATQPAGPDPQPGPDPLYPQQWDKMRMNASSTGSYAVQRGRRDVVVATLDSGVELLHPDIAPSLDVARSRSFSSDRTLQDHIGHGSWIASAVAAPINGYGMVGVAPSVTVVSLKVTNLAGGVEAFAVANALVYAGDNHFDVANMSFYFILDHSHGEALITILQRAIDYARANGVTPVAALGNEDRDLSDGSSQKSSVYVPAELPGVIGVSSSGYFNQKAFYSNYGTGKTDVAGPGGDTRQPPPPIYHGGGRVLGAWSNETIETVPPQFREEQCDPVNGCFHYAWVQGTSMATANASGVAALIVSQYGDFRNSPQKPHMSPTEVEQILSQTADNQPCVCQGGDGYNEYFGKGIVDALLAVTASGNR